MDDGSGNNGLVLYNSKYTHGVDEKRRVQIPAKWRPAESVEFTLVVWKKHEHGACLRALPPQQMAELYQELRAMRNDDPKKEILKRLIGQGSEQVQVDKAGRICIPEPMAAAAGIKNEAVLVGLLDRFEIWSPERYARTAAMDDAHSSEAFRMME